MTKNIEKIRLSKLIYLNVCFFLAFILATTMIIWAMCTHLENGLAPIVSDFVKTLGGIILAATFGFWSLEAHWLFKIKHNKIKGDTNEKN